MTLKSILCVYGGQAFEAGALATSLQLAGRFEAEARFLHLSVPLDVYPELYGITLYGQAVAGDTGVLESIAEANTVKRQAAEASVMQAAKANNVEVMGTACLGPITGRATAIFCPVTARTTQGLTAAGRLADLIVVGREPARAITDLDAILCGLFDTGRPVLVIPHPPNRSSFSAKPERIAMAWDGSLPAARALHQSLPILKQASRIEVICVRPSKSEPDFGPNLDPGRWFDLHGLPAHVQRIELADQTVGDAILAEADRFAADWLIMGAYGHSHVGEMILGGTTNHILKHSSLPLLLAH